MSAKQEVQGEVDLNIWVKIYTCKLDLDIDLRSLLLRPFKGRNEVLLSRTFTIAIRNLASSFLETSDS